MTLKSKIEALLFYKADPTSISYLVKVLNAGDSKVSEGDVKEALLELENDLSERGIKLISKDDTVTLGTAPEASELIESLTKEELNKNLGRAGLEILTIVLYKGPISKSEVDYIRGVNCGSILRNLLIRGLIERKSSPTDKRTFIYSTSLDLMRHLGITNIDELPEYGDVTSKIESFKETFNNEEDEEVKKEEAKEESESIE